MTRFSLAAGWEAANSKSQTCWVIVKRKTPKFCFLYMSELIRTRFACSAKMLHHFNYLMPKCCLFQYVFFLWQVDYALEGSMFWLSKWDFTRLFNAERSWHAYWFPVVFEFLVGISCPLMQEHFLWPLSKRNDLSCGSTRLLGPLFLSKVSPDQNN